MTTVTSVRGVLGTELGTHLVDFTRTLGPHLVNAQIFVEQKEEMADGFIATVVAGCRHGLDLYSHLSEVQLVKTETNVWVLRSNERH